MRSNVKPAPVVVDQRKSGSDALAKLPAQAEDTPKPVMCCCRLDSLIVMSDDWAAPPLHVPLLELPLELPELPLELELPELPLELPELPLELELPELPLELEPPELPLELELPELPLELELPA